METDYFNQFDNRNLERMIEDPKLIPLLNSAIQKEKERLTEFNNKLKLNKNYLGEEVKETRLNCLLEDVATRVNAYLGIKSSDIPQVGYLPFSIKKTGYTVGAIGGFPLIWGTGLMGNNPEGIALISGLGILGTGSLLINNLLNNMYNNKNKVIILNKEKELKLKHTIAHEYVHYLQYEKEQIDEKIKNKKYEHRKYFSEGIACRVADQICKKEGYVYPLTLFNLESAQAWVKYLTTKSLIKRTSQLIKHPYRLIFSADNHYSIGESIFYLEEQEQGSEIYKKIFNKTFQFKVLGN